MSEDGNADVTFAKGLFDSEGDCYDDRIFIHFDERFALPFDNVEQLDKLIENLKQCSDQIKNGL